MKQVGYDDLANLPLVKYYETAFREATGVSLKVMPPGDPEKHLSFGTSENPFCALVSRTLADCEARLHEKRRVKGSATRKLTPQQIHRFAGLTIGTVPVAIDGRHVATLLSGHVLHRKQTQRDFTLVAKMLGGGPNSAWKKKARRAYFETPVVTAERFQAIVDLLSVFAQYLADCASRYAIANSHEEPTVVTSAKQFIQSHVKHPVTLTQVAQHVHLNPFYLCKLFKKATGMTLTEYVARLRVEKAKTLLGDPSLRINEVVYAAGFGSIPRFNSVFKRYVGMPPTQYRATLLTGPPQISIRECQAASSGRIMSVTNCRASKRTSVSGGL
jgi:AraC-like DNA-binding protein/ligand-binding sensor protein